MKQNSFTRNKLKVLALVQLLLLGTLVGFAQDDKFGADPELCRQNISLYREVYKQQVNKQKNFSESIEGWRWAFVNCPGATKNIVYDGPNIIKYMIKANEGNPEMKKAYIDTLMMVHDKRIELYPADKAYVLGRKGMDQYEYANGDYTEAYRTLREALALGKLETEGSAILRLYQSGMKKLVSKTLEMDILYDLYDEVSGVIDHNLKKGENHKSYKYYKQAQEIVDKKFATIAKEDRYIELMKPKVEAAPTDTALLEKVTNMMVKRKWTSNPFYIDASEKLYQLSPSTVAAYNLYEGHARKGNQKHAVKFLKESINLETDQAEKAEKTLKLAQVYGSQKNYSQARSTAQDAAAMKNGWGAPYLLIGSWYMSSAGSCGDDACTKRYGIWAAEDMFIKAKNLDANVASEASKKIASCKKYYPTKKECFFIGIIEAGTKVKVGGWIGVETSARFAD